MQVSPPKNSSLDDEISIGQPSQDLFDDRLTQEHSLRDDIVFDEDEEMDLQPDEDEEDTQHDLNAIPSEEEMTEDSQRPQFGARMRISEQHFFQKVSKATLEQHSSSSRKNTPNKSPEKSPEKDTSNKKQTPARSSQSNNNVNNNNSQKKDQQRDNSPPKERTPANDASNTNKGTYI
jgi:hypothetical protein